MKQHKKHGYLLDAIKNIVSQARSLTIRSVNALQVASNYLIGQRIVEFEQGGAKRAAYGKALLKELSSELTLEFGKGYSKTNLEYMRKFYLVQSKRLEEKNQTVSGELMSTKTAPKAPTLSGLSNTSPNNSNALQVAQTLSDEFPLSWSHYVFLMAVKNTAERSFYEIEAINGNWSLRELKRQFGSSLYERLALSRDKEKVKTLAEEGQIIAQPQDVIKNPYVLEFLGLEEKSKYSENDLETAIIDKLEHFLLELGKGFLFEARQKRFTFDEDHYFVDLVFYNRLLRCYTIIDLKIGELTHQDLGQMQMYVNYYDRHVKLDDENSTIGIILCKKNRKSLVEITLPQDANIHASEYQLYLPSKEELQQHNSLKRRKKAGRQTMKLKFKKQAYQSLAVSAVVDCFQGQPNLSGVKYRIDPGTKPAKLFTASGFKNDDLVLSASQILANIQRVQRARNLPQSQAIAEFKTIKKKGFVFDKSYSKKALAITPYHLDIEMETGTGKTYCYIKSFFELNKRFGWTKFIVVVPSIAIREGVYKSLETTADHFQETYGKKARFFIYNIPS